MPQMLGPSLFGGFFQLGYITRDLDAAIGAFRDRFGAAEFTIFSPPTRPDGTPSPARRIGLTYVDEMMIEIIEPDTGQSTIYDNCLPDQAGTMCLHHLGYLVDDLDATLEQLRATGFAIALEARVTDMLDVCFADTRAELGHYSEFIRLADGGRSFFGSVPRAGRPRGADATD